MSDRESLNAVPLVYPPLNKIIQAGEAERIEALIGPAPDPTAVVAAEAEVLRNRRFRTALLNSVLVRELLQGPGRSNAVCGPVRRALLTSRAEFSAGSAALDLHLAQCGACRVLSDAARIEAAWNSGAPRRRNFALSAGVAAALILGVVYFQGGVGTRASDPGAELVAAAGLPSTAVSTELRTELLALRSDPRYAEIADVLAVDLLEIVLGTDPQRIERARFRTTERLKTGPKERNTIVRLPERLCWLLFEAALTPKQRSWAVSWFPRFILDGERLTRAVHAALVASEEDVLRPLMVKLGPKTKGFDKQLALDMLASLPGKSEAEVLSCETYQVFTRAFPDDQGIYAALEALDVPRSVDWLRCQTVVQRALIHEARGEIDKAKSLVRGLVPYLGSSSKLTVESTIRALRRFADDQLVSALRIDPVFRDRADLLLEFETAAKSNAESRPLVNDADGVDP